MANRVYAACFRAVRTQGLEFDIELSDFRVVAKHGPAETVSLRWIGGGFDCPENGQRILQAGEGALESMLDRQVFPIDDYVFITARVDAPDAQTAYEVGRERITAIRSALRLALGRQVVDCRMFEECYPSNHEREGFAPGVRIDANVPERSYALADFEAAAVALRALDPIATPPSSHLDLALRWFEHAQAQRNLVDRFIACWFALEVFPLKGTRDLGLIRERVDRILGKPAISSNEVHVGRMYGLRGQIAHEGLRGFDADQTIQAEMLFRLGYEVLREALGLPPAGYLAAMLPADPTAPTHVDSTSL